MRRSTVNVEKFYEEDPNLKKGEIELLSNWAKSQLHYPDLEGNVLSYNYNSVVFI